MTNEEIKTMLEQAGYKAIKLANVPVRIELHDLGYTIRLQRSIIRLETSQMEAGCQFEISVNGEEKVFKFPIAAEPNEVRELARWIIQHLPPLIRSYSGA